ncbi:MAG: GDP-mannose 6-dehydrogenase [Paraglaciecola sp.]|jgi:GDP-mannose 6-dehydrogenase
MLCALLNKANKAITMFVADTLHCSTIDGQEMSIGKQSEDLCQNGFNRIVSFGYAENDQHNLPRSRSSKNISVLGLGHMGTVSAIGFAALGHKVIGIDHDQRKVNALNQGRTNSKESGLQQLLTRVARFNNLVATGDSFNAIRRTDVTLICIGNSVDNNDELDSVALMTACEQLGAIIKNKSSFHIFVWCHSISRKISLQTMIAKIENNALKKAGKDFGFCTVQRALRKHQAIEDFYHPKLLTIGSFEKKSADLCSEIFDGFETKVRHIKL